jgi:hypothetical protein
MHTKGDKQGSENYQKPIDAIDLMDHLIDEKISTLEEERDLIYENENQGKGKSKGNQADDKQADGPKQVFFEEVKFKRDDKKTSASFRDFEDKVMLILPVKFDRIISNITAAYIKSSMSPDELFKEFSSIFGPVLVYKYLYIFSRTLRNEGLVSKLYTYMHKELSKLRFRNKNVLSQANTWKDFFHKISDELATNLFSRIDNGKLDISKNYRISTARMFQLFGSIKSLTLKEFCKFKYLNNFIQNPESKATLQRFLFVPLNKSQSMIDKISNIDILVMFVYFNLSCTKFEYGLASYDGKKINPNLLKIFMKHYINYAKDKKYDIVTDDEDFEEVEGIGHQEAGNINNVNSVSRVNKPQNSQYHKKPSEVKRQVFAEEPNAQANIHFDFPELSDNKKVVTTRQQETDKKEKTNVMSNTKGWGKDQTLLYTNEASKRKAMKEEFPELKVEETTESIFNKLNANKPQNNGWGQRFEYREQQPSKIVYTNNSVKSPAYPDGKKVVDYKTNSNQGEFPTLDQGEDKDDIFPKMKNGNNNSTEPVIIKGKFAPSQNQAGTFDNKNVRNDLNSRFGYGVTETQPTTAPGGRNIIAELTRTQSGNSDIVIIKKKNNKR